MLAATLSLVLVQTPPALAPGPGAPAATPATPPATAPPPTTPAPTTELPPWDPAQPSPGTPPPATQPPAADPFAAQPPAAPPPDYAPYPYYPPPPPAPPAPRALPESTTHRRLVFQNTYALNFGVSFIPSGEFGFFLGSDLKPRKNAARTFDWHTALGYQLTLSIGYADVMPQLFVFDDARLFIHRHHFTATGYGGPRQRFYWSAGGGVWMGGSTFMGIEAEGKLGGRFAVREDRRVFGVAGVQMRLGGVVDDGLPLPQLGLFIGFMAF